MQVLVLRHNTEVTSRCDYFGFRMKATQSRNTGRRCRRALPQHESRWASKRKRKRECAFQTPDGVHAGHYRDSNVVWFDSHVSIVRTQSGSRVLLEQDR